MSTFAATEPSTSTNTAIVPLPKIEEDCYDWYARHEDVLRAVKTARPEIVLIGDSITHFWGGEPKSEIVNGGETWTKTFGNRAVLNLGFGWDRTQNALWRLTHGQFDGLAPKLVIILIGTNNLSGTENARANTPAEIVEGILTICRVIHTKSPSSRIVVMGLFPRDLSPEHEFRASIASVNAQLAVELPALPQTEFFNISERFLEPDGTISPEIMGDGVHPTSKGYHIWGNALVEAGLV